MERGASISLRPVMYQALDICYLIYSSHPKLCEMDMSGPVFTEVNLDSERIRENKLTGFRIS